MLSIFKTTSYKTGAALAVAATSFWKLASFASSILIALYFGASADTDVYFYLIMLIGFGVTFMQKLNGSVLVPEAMFLAEEDEKLSRRFLTLGFYFYVLLALALCVLGLLFPINVVGLFSRFDVTLLQTEQLLLCTAFLLFATNLIYYYLLAVAEMHKFFATALLGPLNALLPDNFWQKYRYYQHDIWFFGSKYHSDFTTDAFNAQILALGFYPSSLSHSPTRSKKYAHGTNLSYY